MTPAEANGSEAAALRAEWHALSRELDEVFADALLIASRDESWPLWDRASRIRRRIAEIAATGVTFDE